MKKNVKKLSLLIIIVVVFTCMPVLTASAVSNGVGDSLLSKLNKLTPSNGTHIWCLQYILRDANELASKDCDGKWGTTTKKAVMAFQSDKGEGLSIDGIVGPKTIIALVQYELRYIQKIKGQDGKDLKIDGIVGPNTIFAIKAFQKKRSITQDGVVGDDTWGYVSGYYGC